MSAVKAGAAYVELTTRNSKFLKGLEAAKKRLQDFGASTRMVGARLFGIGAAATAPLAASMAIFSSFDDAMLAVKGVTQATADEFERLRDKAKQLGASTSYSASEVASLMTELGRAGFKPDQIIDMTGAVMNLARATGTDATLASGIFAAAIRQFGLEAGDATRVADGLTAAANKSFNSVESLGEALTYAGPNAADANMSLEETLAILGTLGNLGIQGSSAGNALKRLLTLSAAESEKFQQVFGVVTKDARGNARSLVDVLGEVTEATSNLGTADKAAKFNEVFGLLGITSASAIGKSVTDTRQLLKELQAASGIAQRTADEMDSGIGGAFRILKSSLEGVAIAVGESLSEPLQELARAASGALAGFIKWIEQNHEFINTAAKVAVGVMAAGAALVGIGATLSAAGIAIGGIGTVLGVVSGAVTILGSLLGALLSPVGLVTAAIVGLGAHLLSTSGLGSQALSWLGRQFSVLQTTATVAFGAIGQALATGDIGAAAKILWLTLKMEWLKGTSVLTAYWVGFKNSFLSSTSELIYGAAGIISDGWAAIEAAWTESTAFLADAWSILAWSMRDIWNSTVGFIKKAWVRLKGLFSEDVNVDAEINRIDKESQANRDAYSQGFLQTVGKRDQERLARRDEIERERQGRAGALEQMQAADEAARQETGDAAIAKTASELDQAKRQWKDAVAALKETPTNASADATSGVPKIDDLKKALSQSGQAVAAETKSIENKSTFNAFAIRGLGADSLTERSLRAMEQTAANTKKMIKVLEDSGLYYGA